jgi:cytochrome P450
MDHERAIEVDGTVDVTVAELTADPHPALARLRSRAPVSWVPALDGWLVTRHELAARVMRDPDVFTVDDPRFSTARVVGPSMLSLDGTDHARHRSPFAAAFRPAEVRSRFAEFVGTEAKRLVEAVRPAGSAELRRTVAGPLAVAVVADVLGLVDADAATVLAWYSEIVDAVQGVSAGHEVSSAGAMAFGLLSASVRETIAGARESLLVEAADRLGADEVVSNAAVMMFGGIETTEGMITNAVWHLLSHPDQLALLADRGLVANAVEESLRLEPAAAVVDRYATGDVPLGGARIRRGDLVTVSIAGANRDPGVFPSPDVFDVRRANARQHLAFAHGPHACLAAGLARLETRTVLTELLDRLPGLALAAPSPPYGLVFRKPQALHLRWQGV